MPTIDMPYYQTTIPCEIEQSRFVGCLRPRKSPEYTTDEQRDIIKAALAAPIGSPPLAELVRRKQSILIITSDHTRPMPSGLTLPLLLNEIRSGAPEAKIKILVATGFHRQTTQAELIQRFGELVEQEEIIVHDARDGGMVYKGIMPSGGELWLNELVDWSDLLISEGFIEPHFFAGFSGGRKSVLPGIASEKTVFFNHNAEFIADPLARNGILQNNPIHRDMAFAADAAGLAFMLNVCLNEQKQVIQAFAGSAEAHAAGCKFVEQQARQERMEADIVVTSNGGYPLDLNIYQNVKCMSGAESCVRQDGVIIAFGSCVDGHGSEGFYELFRQYGSAEAVETAIMQRGRDGTMPDQWQAQVLARVLKKAKIVLVTQHCEHELVREFGMIPAKNFAEAMEAAEGIVGKTAKVLFIPNGVEVMT